MATDTFSSSIFVEEIAKSSSKFCEVSAGTPFTSFLSEDIDEINRNVEKRYKILQSLCNRIPNSVPDKL